MTPKEFVAKARGYDGVSVSDGDIDDKPMFLVSRNYGDLHLFEPIPDHPHRLATAVIIAYCRNLGFPVSEFGIGYHDL